MWNVTLQIGHKYEKNWFSFDGTDWLSAPTSVKTPVDELARFLRDAINIKTYASLVIHSDGYTYVCITDKGRFWRVTCVNHETGELSVEDTKDVIMYGMIYEGLGIDREDWPT